MLDNYASNNKVNTVTVMAVPEEPVESKASPNKSRKSRASMRDNILEDLSKSKDGKVFIINLFDLDSNVGNLRRLSIASEPYN